MTGKPAAVRPADLLFGFAAVGVAWGVHQASSEIARQQCVQHGLWRTGLWIARDRGLEGAAIGLAVGLIAALLVAGWRPALRWFTRVTGLGAQSNLDALQPSAFLRLLGFLAVSSVIAGLVVPGSEMSALPGPYQFVVIASFAGLWLLVLALASTASLPESGESSDWSRLRWLTVVGLSYQAIVLRAWAFEAPSGELALVALVGLVSAIAVYGLLRNVGTLALNALGRALSARLLWRGLSAVGYIMVGAAVVTWAVGSVIGARAEAQAAARGRNVIIIAVDTLRADRAALTAEQRGQRDLTPNLRKLLAARGTVFASAISQAPWTMPALASVLTGMYPEEHGADDLMRTLAPERLTLAEILREAGYRTLGVVSHYYAGSEAGLDQGFSAFDESQSLGHGAVTSAEVTDIALRLLRQNSERPFFLFLHYIDPHYTYRDHQEFDFADGYTGWLRNEAGGEHQIEVLRTKQRLLGPADHAYVRDLYDEEIAYTDMHIGRLLQFIDAERLWDSTLVVFVSDHGEEFNEHGWIGHTVSLSEEVIHVPLVVAAPSQKASHSSAHPVETRWIFGTVLDFLGLSPPAGVRPGPSLLEDVGGEERLVRSSTRPLRRADQPDIESGKYVWLSCLVGPQWKLVKDHLTGAVALFDRGADPQEDRDLGAERPEVHRGLERSLDSLNADLEGRSTAPPLPKADEKQMRRLKALGYL